MAEQNKASGRLAFIDWTRGLAAVIMLQGHTFNSFTRTDLRDKGPYMLSQFFGGLPPAIFLFLTGITFAFIMDGQERKGVSGKQKLMVALKRSGFLFMLAFLFRIQLFVFGWPTSPASELLKVDILNCMGMAMLVFAPMALFTTHERIRLCAILGCVVAGLAPVISSIDNPSVPWLVHAYFFPDLNSFGFFPWASFLAFGMVVGSVIRMVKADELGRVMLWTLGVSLGLIMAAQYLSSLPYSLYSKSDFWLNSPALTAIKIGVVLAMLSAAYAWVSAGDTQRWSLFRQLGTSSLLVYWVHIELVYGRWFGFWKEAMTVPEVVLYSVVLIAFMTLLSILWKRRHTFKPILFRTSAVPAVQRASGD